MNHTAFPITTRQQMIALVEAVAAGRTKPMEALVHIERWGDDFARRNVEDYKQRHGITHENSGTADGRRLPIGPNLS